MKRLNVTLALEEDLLREARVVAARRQTSVNDMVREYLREIVNGDERRSAAFGRIQGFLEDPPVTLSVPRPSRDDLHER